MKYIIIMSKLKTRKLITAFSSSSKKVKNKFFDSLYKIDLFSYKSSDYLENLGLEQVKLKKETHKFIVVRASFKHNKTKEQYGLTNFKGELKGTTYSPSIFEIFLFKHTSLSMYKYCRVKNKIFFNKI